MNIAKTVKVDEFYTLMSDVEFELQHYKPLFKGKVVYCCCDNPLYSNFCKYFSAMFTELGLKRFICSWFQKDKKYAEYAEYDINTLAYKYYIIEGDGGVESKGFFKLLEQADIIITNPPFSKSQAFIENLLLHNKKFILICNRNTVITKRIFPYFVSQTIRFGYGFKNNTAIFEIPPTLYGHYSKDVVRKEECYVRFRNVSWITNFDIVIPPPKITLTKRYSPRKYKKYDQYDAINVDKIIDIPYDYDGEMGVPITILDKFDYSNFELLGLDRFMPLNKSKKRFTVDGNEKYARVIIRRK